LKSSHSAIAFTSKDANQWLSETTLTNDALVINSAFPITIVIDTNEGFDVNF
jgi:hypothetical protein